MKKYAIDSCSLINAAKYYNLRKSTFESIWEKLANMINSGELISTVEVKEELKDDELLEWIKVNNCMFIPLSEKIQKKATDILKEYPTLIKMKSSGNSNADPFLIATSIIENATIISDERKGDETSRDYHIPNVCEHYDIECITLQAFLDIIIE